MNKKLDAPSKTKAYKKARKEFLEHVGLNSTIASNYGRWYAGISKNPDDRKKNHTALAPNGTLFWKQIDLKSVRLSLALETSLHNLGFLDTDQKGGYDRILSKWVYIYKKYPTIFDSKDE